MDSTPFRVSMEASTLTQEIKSVPTPICFSSPISFSRGEEVVRPEKYYRGKRCLDCHLKSIWRSDRTPLKSESGKAGLMDYQWQSSIFRGWFYQVMMQSLSFYRILGRIPCYVSSCSQRLIESSILCRFRLVIAERGGCDLFTPKHNWELLVCQSGRISVKRIFSLLGNGIWVWQPDIGSFLSVHMLDGFLATGGVSQVAGFSFPGVADRSKLKK